MSGAATSALSVFGLVPAALHGVDLAGLLAGAAAMADACRRPAHAQPRPAARRRHRRGGARRTGQAHDPDHATAGEPGRLDRAARRGEHRQGRARGHPRRRRAARRGGATTAPIAVRGRSAWRASPTRSRGSRAGVRELEGLGHPLVRIELADPLEIGAEFVRWEVATAAVGMVLGIDPFDQPNVQEAKDATKALLDAYRRDGSPAAAGAAGGGAGDGRLWRPRGPRGRPGDGRWRAARADRDWNGRRLLRAARLSPRGSGHRRAAPARPRAWSATGLGLATTLGFGPRFLHSTGQLHKGGPASGVFLQLTADPRRDLPIPGWPESFGTLIAAQAAGDLAAHSSDAGGESCACTLPIRRPGWLAWRR